MTVSPTGTEQFHRWIGADLELRIRAQPGAKKTEVSGIHGGLLKIRVRARAKAPPTRRFANFWPASCRCRSRDARSSAAKNTARSES
jgi:hypothetical protein